MGAEIAARMANPSANPLPAGPNASNTNNFTQIDGFVLQNGLGASKVDVVSWMTKAWMAGTEFLTLKDQVYYLSKMASLYHCLGMKRKEAFFLRLTGISTQILAGKRALKFDVGRAPSILCMERSLELISQFKPSITPIQTEVPVKLPPPIRYGSQNLQIFLLRECIDMSQSNLDFGYTVLFISKLLRFLYQYLSKDDQAELSETLQKVSVHAKALVEPMESDNTELASPLHAPLMKADKERILGVPILKSMALLE